MSLRSDVLNFHDRFLQEVYLPVRDAFMEQHNAFAIMPERIEVIVHPHFALLEVDPEGLPRRVEKAVRENALPSPLDFLAAESTYLKSILQAAEGMQGVYRERIQAAKKNPGTGVLILAEQHGYSDMDLTSLSKTQRVDVDDLIEVLTLFDSYQQRVLSEASELGGQLVIRDDDPYVLGSVLKEVLGPFRNSSFWQELPIRVYGEVLSCCVTDSRNSLQEAGFLGAKTVVAWCLG